MERPSSSRPHASPPEDPVPPAVGEGGEPVRPTRDRAFSDATLSEQKLSRIDYTDQRNLSHQTLLDKFRLQLPIILGCSILFQFVVAFLISPANPLIPSSRNAIIACLIANAASLLNYRRLRLFPGARRFAFLLPAFLPPYIVLGALLLWLRPNYSVILIAVGLFSAIGLAAIFNLINRNVRQSPLLLIPSPKVNELLRELPLLHHKMCQAAEQLRDSRTTIVADLHEDLDPEWDRAIAQAALNGSTIYHVKQIRESLTGRVRIDHFSENSTGTLKPNDFYFAFKSLAERFASAVALLIALPIIAFAALAIRLESSGSPIFRQPRIGFRGKVFTIYKLRTMMVSTAGESRDSAITKANDPRITRLGRFLRKTRIDELPQLWNVVRGDLSLIGPRPEALSLSEWYYEQLDFYAYRHIVRPGITGWAQVNQGHVADPADVYLKLQYDFYYIKNFSLWLDILIVLKTVGVVFSGRGAR